MWRIFKVTKEDNMMLRVEEGEFGLFYDKDELKTYDDIENKFKNFKLDEEYETELKDEGYESITYFKFFLYNEDDYLFSMKLVINSLTDLRYDDFLSIVIGDEMKTEVLHDFHKDNFIKIKYETKFFKFNEFDDEEEEDEDDNPPPVASSYPSEFCVICYSEKPNILNYPCLHISQCEDCDEKGRFIKCIMCKEEIMYKIKI